MDSVQEEAAIAKVNRKALVAIALLFLLFALSACTPGPNPLENASRDAGTIAGFWQGLWHGIIAPITFVISIFRADVRLYEVYNDGFWYNLGFVLGAGVLFKGSSSATRL